MFSNPFPNAFGLDIGDLSVKLVQLRNHSNWRRNPRYELVTARSIKLPPGLIVDGELQKPEEVRKRIQKLLLGTPKQKIIKSPWVVSSLPEMKSFVKLIYVNSSIDEIIEDDIINEAKKHIPFEENDYYLNWQFVTSNEKTKKSKILIGAVPKTISDSYTYLLESLGLGVVALEIEAIPILRTMSTAKKIYKDEARAILDIGAARSSLIVYDNDMIQFSTSLPYSGEIATTALTQNLRISREEAEKIKEKQGLEYTKSKNKSWKTLNELTTKLAKEIDTALNFYYSHFPNSNKIKRIIMCGGGSNLKRLDKILSAKLKILSRPGKPWKNLFAKKIINIDEQESLKYATAIGSALRAADNPFFTHDVI